MLNKHACEGLLLAEIIKVLKYRISKVTCDQVLTGSLFSFSISAGMRLPSETKIASNRMLQLKRIGLPWQRHISVDKVVLMKKKNVLLPLVKEGRSFGQKTKKKKKES